MQREAERDTHHAILESARDLLVKSGLDGLSMRKVAQAVGVSATALYRHFDSKDALLSAAVAQGAQTFGSYLVDALGETTPRQRLEQMGRRYFDFAREHHHDYQLLFMFDCNQAGMTELDQRAQDETAQTFVLLLDRVIECQAAGELIPGDPTTQAVYIWSSYHGLASLKITGRLPPDDQAYQALIEQQIRLTLNSLRPPGKVDTSA